MLDIETDAAFILQRPEGPLETTADLAGPRRRPAEMLVFLSEAPDTAQPFDCITITRRDQPPTL